MPRDRVAFPAAINRRLRLHPRIGSEIVEQAVGYEAVEAGAVHLDRRREIGRFQAHRVQGQRPRLAAPIDFRSVEPTSDLQSLMRSSVAVFALKKNNTHHPTITSPWLLTILTHHTYHTNPL